MPNAIHSFNTALTYGAATSVDQVAELGEVTSVNAPNISVSSVDATHLKSADAFREFIPGLGDGGEITVTLNYTKQMTATLYGLLRTEQRFRVTFPDGSWWRANGFITSLGTAAEEDSEISQDVTIKVTGKPLFTASA